MSKKKDEKDEGAAPDTPQGGTGDRTDDSQGDTPGNPPADPQKQGATTQGPE